MGSRTLATNSYDTLGRLTGTVYGNGDKVENVYNIMSRITSVKYDGVERVKYTYDNDGNISKIDDKFTNIVTTFHFLVGDAHAPATYYVFINDSFLYN